MRKANNHVGLAFDNDGSSVCVKTFCGSVFLLFKFACKLLLALNFSPGFHQFMQCLPGCDSAVAYGRINIIHFVHGEAFQQRFAQFGLRKVGKLLPLSSCGIGKHFFAADNIFFTIRLFEPLFDFCFGLGCFYKVKPVAARRCLRVRNDFNNIVGFKLAVKLHKRTVDFCVLCVVADVRMNTVSKINGR